MYSRVSLRPNMCYYSEKLLLCLGKTRDTTYLRDPLTQKWQVWPEGSIPFDFLDPDKMITSILDGLSGPTLLSSRGGFFKISGQIATSSFDYIFQDTLSTRKSGCLSGGVPWLLVTWVSKSCGCPTVLWCSPEHI